MSLFGATSQSQSNSQQPKPFSFGTSSTGAAPSNLFGQSKPPEQKPFSFGPTQQPGGSIFGNPNQQSITQQPGASIFGGSAFGQSTQQQQQQPQRPADQTLRFRISTSEQQQNHAQSMWEEGRGLGVYRSIPAQMNIIKDKWDAATLSSPLRTYIYQHVGDEKEALRYRPGPEDDEDKWEEAVSKRPGPEWVPLVLRGFLEMGRKAQLQTEAMQRCNMILQEINNSLDIQLDIHRQKVAARLAEAKRRQLAISRRTLALAVKVQILRNKGYVMDNAEEELKAKLEKLEREVFDPSREAREQEIWARMLGIRERAKRLKIEMENLAPAANTNEPNLDGATLRTAKALLEDYETQLRHLHGEMEAVKSEFTAWEKLSNNTEANYLAR